MRLAAAPGARRICAGPGRSPGRRPGQGPSPAQAARVRGVITSPVNRFAASSQLPGFGKNRKSPRCPSGRGRILAPGEEANQNDPSARRPFPEQTSISSAAVRVVHKSCWKPRDLCSQSQAIDMLSEFAWDGSTRHTDGQ